jgi:hypothetical protein
LKIISSNVKKEAEKYFHGFFGFIMDFFGPISMLASSTTGPLAPAIVWSLALEELTIRVTTVAFVVNRTELFASLGSGRQNQTLKNPMRNVGLKRKEILNIFNEKIFFKIIYIKYY